MKNIIIFTITVLALSCGSANSNLRQEEGTNRNGEEKPTFTCSLSKPEANNYHLNIDVFKSTMIIKQSASNARFAVLKFSMKEDKNLQEPNEQPQFSCSLQKADANNYTLRIHVYEDKLFILQSSRNARFAPIKYRIATAGLQNKGFE